MAEAPNNRLVSVAEMRHAVIDGYKYELWRLFEYGREHPQLNWFTPYASAHLDESNSSKARGMQMAPSSRQRSMGARALHYTISFVAIPDWRVIQRGLSKS